MQEFNLKYKNMNAYQFRKSMSVSKTYSHLYHYAGNNPIRYIDPDGKYVAMDSYFTDLISNIYNKSRTFRYYFNNLLLPKNVLNENLFVYIRLSDNISDTSTAITKTDNLTIPEETTFFTIDDDGNIFKVNIPEKTVGQVIIIDIDYKKFRVRNKVSIIAEEVYHAWEARLMGAKKWNTLSTEENEKYDYYDRPREQRAKAAATVVEEEYQR